ncbi:helix-turn-helix transcriptional regulator [Pendulispora albinea]|uniref:YafY family transcriptional regulator n=1 Tax=Pendulispora albinea TaxID=2741071 RepID=A0ABZ2M4B5_9BACT
MSDPSRRMLQLLSLLQSGRSWGGHDLAERLGVSARTLRRDMDRLKELGYPVETARGPEGYYRLTAGKAMPPLLLEDDEAVAIAIGLRLASAGTIAGIAESSANASRKLEQVLPARLQRRVRALHASTEAAPSRWPQVDAHVLQTIASACHKHQRLRLTYRTREREPAIRRVEPYRQVLSKGRWYLLGWDLDRHDWRTFRVDRVMDLEDTGMTFAPRELPSKDASTFLHEELKTLVPRHHAVVTFDAPLAEVASRLGGKDGTLEELDPNRCRYSADVDSFEWLAITVAISGFDYAIEQPAGFIAYSRELAARIAMGARRGARARS